MKAMATALEATIVEENVTLRALRFAISTANAHRPERRAVALAAP